MKRSSSPEQHDMFVINMVRIINVTQGVANSINDLKWDTFKAGTKN